MCHRHSGKSWNLKACMTNLLIMMPRQPTVWKLTLAMNKMSLSAEKAFLSTLFQIFFNLKCLIESSPAYGRGYASTRALISNTAPCHLWQCFTGGQSFPGPFGVRLISELSEQYAQCFSKFFFQSICLVCKRAAATSNHSWNIWCQRNLFAHKQRLLQIQQHKK